MSRRTVKPAAPANRFAALFTADELQMPVVAAAILQYRLAADDPDGEGLSRSFASGYNNLEESDARYAYGSIIAHFHPGIDY